MHHGQDRHCEFISAKVEKQSYSVTTFIKETPTAGWKVARFYIFLPDYKAAPGIFF